MIFIAGISLFVGLNAVTGEIGDHRISFLAAKILRGEIIQHDTLKVALFTPGDHNQSCATAHLPDSVIVRLRFFENLSGLLHIKEADLQLTILRSESRDLLACRPTESFTWLLQFWLNAISGRSDVSNWKFLEQSYEAGLYEGWVAARRSQIVVASLDLAPEPLQDKIVREFRALLEYNFVDDGVRLYTSASEPTKRRLSEAVRMLGVVQRQSFASHLESLTPSELLFKAVGGQSKRTSSGKILP